MRRILVITLVCLAILSNGGHSGLVFATSEKSKSR
jgi:hypothetical protein